MPRRARLAALVSVLLLAASAGAAPDGVEAGRLAVEVASAPWRLVFRDLDAGVLLAEATDLGPAPAGPVGFRTAAGWVHARRVLGRERDRDALVLVAETTDPDGRRLRVRLVPEADSVIALEATVEGGTTADVEALGIAFEARPGERFFGFGERADAVDHRGQVVESYVSDGPYQVVERPLVALFVPPPGFRARDDATYFPLPWVLSSAGWGVLSDAPDTAYHRLGSERPDVWSVEVVGAPEGMAPAPAPAALRLRVFAGPTPADVLRRFTARTGRQPEAAAPWVFGPWFQPGGSLADQVAQIEKLRAADAPVSVAQTYLHYLPCGDQQGREDDEQEHVAALHSTGVAVTTYFNPMVCESYAAAFGPAAAAGALMRDAGGAPYVYDYTGSTVFRVAQFDFFTLAGRDAYARLLAEAVAHGHDGWMEDFGEYTPLDAFTADGRPGTETHNPYPVAYHCAAWDFVRRQPRPLVRFQRSGWTGAAPCAQVVWNGDPTTGWDFDGLRSAVRGALGLGLSGVSTWGSDVGGFFALGDNALTAELLARWVQLGALSPVMRTERNGFALPAKVRPQVDDDDQLPNWRRWAKLHTQLYPYLRGAEAEYRRAGMPIMRHLVLAHPDDPVATARDDEFLFGPDLLAAPVLAPGAREREVYLPAGDWVDLWRAAAYDAAGDGGLVLGDAAVVSGPRSTTVPAPLDELPLFVRAGAVLPLLPADVDTLADYGDPAPGLVRLADRTDRLALLALPRGRRSARIGRDERVTSIERRDRWRLLLRLRRRREIDLQASLATLAAPFTPCTVEWRGRPLPDGSWSWDPATRVLRAAFAGRRGALDVRPCGPLLLGRQLLHVRQRGREVLVGDL
jgi:alpha-glucosidase (family GH31 glycosyl hydrolase)